jgi:hypothetical protein
VMPSAATGAVHWALLSQELDHWAEAGRTAALWLRDDDAVVVTPALERLVTLCETHRAPALLAVVPAAADAELAAYLDTRPLFEVAAHGFSHWNYAPAGAKKQEFPPDRDRDQIQKELAQGRRRLRDMFGPILTDIFVPPWNRIGKDVAERLPTLGFRALSGYGREPLFESPPPLIEINAQLDIIDWRGNRGGHEAAWLAANLAGHLAWARAHGWRPVGILAHHLVHDAAAWGFLEELFEQTAAHPAVTWRRAGDLIC